MAKTGLALAILRRSRSSLLGSATAQLGGIAPYHYADYINNRMLYAGADVGTVAGGTGYSFTRASGGYYTNSDGTLTLFGSGALRRGDRGVLIEGSRTNLLLRSQEFDNAAWTKTAGGTGLASVVTANAGVAPDGTTTADSIVFDRGAGNTLSDQSYLFQSPVGSAGSYTQTVWLKAATAGDVGKQLALRNVAASAYLVVTLTADWVRYTRTETYATDNWALANRGTITADNTVTALVWGAQLEAASFASSYIPTVAAAATRAADVLTYTAGVSYPFSAYAEYVRGGDAASQNAALTFAVTTSADQVHIGNNTGGVTQRSASLYVRNAGDQAYLDAGAGTANVGATVRQAVRIGTNDFAQSVNGSAVLTDTSGTVPTMTTMRVGTDVGNTQFMFGHIRRFAIFNSALTDAQLQTTTS